jgi:hypothetical protein
MCPEKELKVNRNLRWKLLALRSTPLADHNPGGVAVSTSVPQLWVDQLSINQGDKIERAQQVKIIQSIYQRVKFETLSLSL